MIIRDVYRVQSAKVIEFDSFASIEPAMTEYFAFIDWQANVTSALKRIYLKHQEKREYSDYPTAFLELSGDASGLNLEVLHNRDNGRFYLSLWSRIIPGTPSEKYDFTQLQRLARFMGAPIAESKSIIELTTEPVGQNHYLLEFEQLLAQLTQVQALQIIRSAEQIANFTRNFILEFGKWGKAKDFDALIGTQGIVAQDDLVQLYFIPSGKIGMLGLPERQSVVVHGTTVRGLTNCYVCMEEDDSAYPSLELHIVPKEERHFLEASITTDASTQRRQNQVANQALQYLRKLLLPEAEQLESIALAAN